MGSLDKHERSRCKLKRSASYSRGSAAKHPFKLLLSVAVLRAAVFDLATLFRIQVHRTAARFPCSGIPTGSRIRKFSGVPTWGSCQEEVLLMVQISSSK